MTDEPDRRRTGPDGPHRFDLAFVILLTAGACAFAALKTSLEPLSMLAAAILVLFLPGYALMCIGWGPGRLRLLFRFVGWVSASLVVAALGGLALNYVGPGLTRPAWATYLTIVTIGGSVVAWVRWPAAARAVPRSPALSASDGAALTAACALVVAGLYVAITSARHQQNRTAPFTALSIERSAGAGASRDRIKVTIRSYLRSSEGLWLTVYAGQTRITSLGFAAAPGRLYVATLSVPPKQRDEKLAAYLQRAGSPAIYRFVTLKAESRA